MADTARDPIQDALNELWAYMEEYGAPEVTRKIHEEAVRTMTDHQEGEGLHGVRMDYSEEVMEAERRVELMSEKIIGAMRGECYNPDSYAQEPRYPDYVFQHMLQAAVTAAAEEYGAPHHILPEDKAAILDRILAAAYPVDPYD